MSVNSAAVLRLTGRGSGPIAGVSRGRSTSRGRGKIFNFAVVHVAAVQLLKLYSCLKWCCLSYSEQL